MSNLYVRKNGERVIVMGSPVAGQLRFVAAKRTAIDGDEWWLAYDNEKGDWVRPSYPAYKISNKFKTRKECEAEIAKALLETKLLEFVPYDGEESSYKKGKQKFSVAVYWTVQRSYEVEAEGKEEAQRKIQEKVDKGDVCVWTDGFEAGDDVTVETQGVEKQNGEWEWFAPQEGK